MKRHIALVAVIALLASAAVVLAQQEETSSSSATTTNSAQGSTVNEPSGAEPSMPANPVISSPAMPTSATDTNAAAMGGSVITVSRSFTNQPNAITILGMVGSEQEKQQAETALQQALPGKTINNHLMVSQQGGIMEPAGAQPGSTNQMKTNSTP